MTTERKPKVGDKVIVLRITSRDDMRKWVGRISRIKELSIGHHYGPDTVIIDDEGDRVGMNWYLGPGDYELLPDFEDDALIKSCRDEITKDKAEIDRINNWINTREKQIAARISELEAALTPKPTLPAIELAWLKHWNAPQYGIDDAMKYGSLSEAYEALKNRVNGRDCTSYGLWCHNQLGTVYTTNPFKSTAFKQQIAMLEKLAPAEVRK